MFEKFTSPNIDSFRQRYEGTYGFYKDETNKRLLVRLTEISPNRCTFVDAKDIPFTLYPDSPRNIGFEFLPPKSAWYNTPDGATFCSRVAARQFQRGVSGKNLQAYLLKAGQLLPRRVDFQTLSSVYEKALTPKEAFAKYGTKQGLAISSQFALDSNCVFLNTELIGTYKEDGKKFLFQLAEPQLWRTEITDALTNIGCTAEVK